ncbi:hypothetical protein ACHAPV_005141 [Trichoderma viride]
MGGAAAYCTSKALTERAAWDWMAAEKPPLLPACINSLSTFGPHLTPIAPLTNLNTSSAMLWQMMDTTDVRPTDFLGFADVRVVATAHLEAFERPEAARERFLYGQSRECVPAWESDIFRWKSA